jgi:hypothetical protein
LTSVVSADLIIVKQHHGLRLGKHNSSVMDAAALLSFKTACQLSCNITAGQLKGPAVINNGRWV